MAAVLVPVPAIEPATNSTVSAPSRSTASATAINNAHGFRWPASIEVPRRRASLAICQPCVDTHTQCHNNITSAIDRMPMLTRSWPMPSLQALILSAITAIASAPITPRTTPTLSHLARSATCRVAAAIMPTNSAASSVSRNTMSTAANICWIPAYSATTVP